jgi:perosamine synthetase
MFRLFDEQDLARLQEVLASGNLCAIPGAQVPAFEREFAAAMKAPYAVAVCNAMAGLHAAVAAAGAGAGDEVIVDPMVTFAALAALYNNAIPVFADIDPTTHTMDPATLEACLSERTKCIIVTHLWGLCAAMDPILEFARRHGLLVIEDCAHALFATYQGRYAGTLGDLGVFSFQQSKHMTTGDGGMVLCQTEELRDRVRSMVHFSTVPPRLAWNYRMNELTAAVGRVQLTRAREYVRQCQENARYYHDAVAGCSWIQPQAVPPGHEHVYHIWAAAFYGERVGVSLAAFQAACQEMGVSISFGYIGQPAYLHETIAAPVAYGRGCPIHCPLRARPLAYQPGLCPQAEDLMGRLMLIYTGGESDQAQANAARLRQAIEKVHPA